MGPIVGGEEYIMGPRVSYRILSWGGGEHDGSRMIVACESTLTHV